MEEEQAMRRCYGGFERGPLSERANKNEVTTSTLQSSQSPFPPAQTLFEGESHKGEEGITKIASKIELKISHVSEEELRMRTQFDFSRLSHGSAARHAHHCGKIVHHELSLSLSLGVCLSVCEFNRGWREWIAFKIYDTVSQPSRLPSEINLGSGSGTPEIAELTLG